MVNYKKFITEADITVRGGQTKLAPEVKTAYDWYQKKYPNASEKNKQYALGALDAAWRKRTDNTSSSIGKTLTQQDGKVKTGKTSIDFGKWKSGDQPDYIQQMHKNMDTSAAQQKVSSAAQSSRVGTNTFKAAATAKAKTDQAKLAAGDKLNRDQSIVRRVDSVMTKASATKTADKNNQDNQAKTTITQADAGVKKDKTYQQQVTAGSALRTRTPETAKPVGQTSSRGATGTANRAMAVRASAKAGDILPSGNAKADFKLRDFANKQKELKSVGAVSDRADEIRDASRTQTFQQSVNQKARQMAVDRVDVKQMSVGIPAKGTSSTGTFDAAMAAQRAAAAMVAKRSQTPVPNAVRPSAPVSSLPAKKPNPVVSDRAAEFRNATRTPRAVNAATTAYQRATRIR